MEPINLEPRYSSAQLPGKCLNCLAEQKLDRCLRQLLIEEGESKELERRYAALLTFLKSPRSKKLRNEAEKYLSDGKDVRVVITSKGNRYQYELLVSEPDTKEALK